MRNLIAILLATCSILSLRLEVGQAAQCSDALFATPEMPPESIVPPAGRIRTEAEITDLTLMSFNVANLYTSTGKMIWRNNGRMQVMPADSLPKPKSPADLAKIRDIILKENPDVAILTEVEDIYALQKLASEELGGKYKLFLIEGNDGRGIDIGFLVKADLPWHIVHRTHRDLRWKNPKTGIEGPMFSRDLPVLEFRRGLLDEDPLFVVVGNHAKSKRDTDGDRESFDWRSAQYQTAAKILSGYEARKIPIIFGGDFNTDIGTGRELRPLWGMMASSLAVAPNALPIRDRVTHTYHPNGKSTQRSWMDDILVSWWLASAITSSTIVRYTDAQGNVLPIPNSISERNRQPSDHFPVVTKILTRALYQPDLRK